MKKRVFAVLLSLLMSLSLSLHAFASEDITVMMDGQQMSFNTDPVIVDGSTLVPLRTIFESMNAYVSWDNQTKTVQAVRDEIGVTLTIGSDVAYKNGIEFKLNTPGMIINGSTLVPLRFISESFGAEVGWEQATKTVTITTREITYDVTLYFPIDRYPQTASHISMAIEDGDRRWTF